jgi:hypothetical protein
MKYYFLTDNSDKSLAPFFSKRILETVMAGTVIVGAILVVFWSRRPLSDLVATGDVPTIFFIIFAATLIVNSYVNLSCGAGEMVRRGYHIINYGTDKPTYEKEIDFYRYGLIEFTLHGLILLLPFVPLLAMAAFGSAVSLITFTQAVAVLYTSSMFCRLSGFLVYLFWGRSSTPGYFAARALMILFVFVTILFAPAVNPLHILYLLNHVPASTGNIFKIYMASAVFAILILILVCNARVRWYINKNDPSEVQGSEVQS